MQLITRVAYTPPRPPKDAVVGHLCMVSPDLCTYQSLMPTRCATLVHFLKRRSPWWIKLQDSGLARLCQAELLAWLPSMKCRTHSLTAWVELLLPSQLKASSFESVCWRPVNHKPYSKSSYHFIVLLPKQFMSRLWGKNVSWVEDNTWNFGGKKCMWC